MKITKEEIIANQLITRIIVRTFAWFCPPSLYESIEGDLLEQFEEDVKFVGEKKAKRMFVWSVLKFFRLSILFRNRFSFGLNSGCMIKNHFKIAFRHLMKSKTITAINLVGLSIGIAAFLIIVQYVSFEMSFDQFHSNKNEIYRIGLNRFENGGFKEKSARTFSGVRALLKENFPEVKDFTGFLKIPANTGFLFRYNGKIYNEGGGVLSADSAFFNVFPSLLASGNPSKVLKGKNDLLISESMAKKLFGDDNAVGKHIERIDDYDEGFDYVVRGVFKDVPANSHIHANFIGYIDDAWSELANEKSNWKQSGVSTYVTLAKGIDSKQIENRLNAIFRKLESKNPDLIGANVFLQPITEIHLQSNLKDELEPNGSNLIVYAMGFIGIVILAIAWINYVNLETARFISRIKEVGIRRIVGSSKYQLLAQFLVEYFCLALVAICIAGLILYFFTPNLKQVIAISFENIFSWNNEVMSMAAVIFIIGSIIVGIYPGLFLLKFNPTAVLKGRLSGQTKGAYRKYLVVFQFMVSMTLIAIVMVIDRQLDFMLLSNKKIDVEHVIVLRNPTAYSGEDLKIKHTSYEVFKNRAVQNTFIKEMTSSSAVPGAEIGFSYVNLIKKDTNALFDPTIYKTLFVDDNFISTYDLHLIAGHNFTQPKINHEWIEPWTDPNWKTIILNKSAIKELGFGSPEEAIDQTIYFTLFDNFQKYKIIGVVDDYHHESIKKQIFPTIFASNYRTFQQVYFSVKINAGSNPADALSFIEKTWKGFFPEKPFDYFFLDDHYDKQFKSEYSASRIFVLFAAVAILIASLGIFGVTLFEANARLKEISIRKVLGASTRGIVALLSKSNFKIVLLSMLLTIPLIYFIANEWLSHYPVRIELSFFFYFMPFVIVSTTVAITASFQTLKAANSNPIDHLKNE
ncbi:MAG: ABC transporter permease [Cyclobacteriaceae bacterium]